MEGFNSIQSWGTDVFLMPYLVGSSEHFYGMSPGTLSNSLYVDFKPQKTPAAGQGSGFRSSVGLGRRL